MTKEDQERLSKEVYARLEEAGLPVDVWKKEIDDQRAKDPTGEVRPFEQMKPSPYGTAKNLKVGYVETKLHAHHGKPVLRCQASKRRSGGQQCGSYAVKGKTVCFNHGGAPRSGKLTTEGRAAQIAASTTKGGTETKVIRAERKTLNTLARSLKADAITLGLTKKPRIRKKPELNYDDD